MNAYQCRARTAGRALIKWVDTSAYVHPVILVLIVNYLCAMELLVLPMQSAENTRQGTGVYVNQDIPVSLINIYN